MLSPLGGILSQLVFNNYMHSLIQQAGSFGLGCHQYVNDTQLYLLMEVHSVAVPSNQAGLEAMIE